MNIIEKLIQWLIIRPRMGRTIASQHDLRVAEYDKAHAEATVAYYVGKMEGKE